MWYVRHKPYNPVVFHTVLPFIVCLLYFHLSYYFLVVIVSFFINGVASNRLIQHHAFHMAKDIETGCDISM